MPSDIANRWADYWRTKVGVNVIPNDSVNKKPLVEWKRWHTEPVPQDVHDQWKSQGMFDKGMALCVGRAWHLVGSNLYFVAIDCDNLDAVNYANGNLPMALMAQESRGSNEKLHLYCYVKEQMENYSPDDDAPVRIELHARAHLITCTPSQYGRKEKIDNVETCVPTGTYYKLLKPTFGVVDHMQLQMPAKAPKKRKRNDGALPFDTVTLGNRNKGFFNVCVTFMKKFKVSEKFDNDLAWLYLWNYNLKYFKPPLDEVEARSVFESSLNYKSDDEMCEICKGIHSSSQGCILK